MLEVGGWLISQLPGGLSVKTDARKFESTSALSGSVSICNIRPEDTYRRKTKLSLKTTG